jgi:aminoglycoside phosphotransferase (APT) family kinase protein
LQHLIAARVEEATDIEITNLTRTSSGYSRENWPFDVSWRVPGSDARVRHQLIMRRDPIGSVLVTDRRVEFAVLRALEGTAVPAPRPLWLDEEGEFLGRPSVVMERCQGLCDWYVLSGGVSQLPEDRRLVLAQRFCELMATIHAVDWRSVHLDDVFVDPGSDGAGAAIAEWERYLHEQQLEAQPELEVVLSWLLENKPVAQKTVLVHGDFKPGNVLIDGDKIVVMLDWETAHLGDPLEDVGWVTNPLRAREHQIPGVWEREHLCRYYESITGCVADEAAVHFWNVFANFKLTAIMLTGVRTAVEGRGDRVFTGPSRLLDLLFRMIEA